MINTKMEQRGKFDYYQFGYREHQKGHQPGAKI